MTENIATEYIARALPDGTGGFYAEYGFPGGERRFVLQDGQPKWFERRGEASAEAGAALVGVLNSRPYFVRPSHITRLPPADFAVRLARLRVTPNEFATIYGQPQKKVMDWIDGREPLPHAAHVLVELLTIPGALAKAIDIAGRYVQRIDQDAPRVAP